MRLWKSNGYKAFFAWKSSEWTRFGKIKRRFIFCKTPFCRTKGVSFFRKINRPWGFAIRRKQQGLPAVVFAIYCNLWLCYSLCHERFGNGDEYFMRLALQQAEYAARRRSTCRRVIGCNNEVIARDTICKSLTTPTVTPNALIICTISRKQIFEQLYAFCYSEACVLCAGALFWFSN